MPPKFKRTFSLEEATSSNREETAVLLEHKSGSEDEDYFLNGPTGKTSFGNQDDERVRQVQAQIAEVTGVMRDNVGKIMERGDQLENLQVASDRLSAASYDFQSASTRIKRRAWAQHMKIRAIIAALSVLVIVGILVPIIVHYSS
ncbi:hypothetical protein R5R35_007505 [Gryllus longicercus]|uniref:V-SNARE coiled-coil homology domain-containing protein n=1 Tax=Gryllus longicercus TaxID=2509291 RepID=A0AAN9VPU6_9ORTH